MKRIFCVLAALALLCGAMIFHIGAAEQLVLYPTQTERFLSPQTADLDTELDDPALEAYLRQSFMNFTTEIDVREFNLLLTQECVDDVALLIEYELPECYHVANCSFYGYEGDPYIYTIRVTYSMTPQQYAADHAVWEEVEEEIVGDLRGDTSLTEVQKALLIHDRLALHCEYDTVNYEKEEAGMEGAIPDESYTAYGALVDGVAVCEGYAKAYKYLLEQVDIPAFLCTSLDINHMWNIVNVNGEYYHVDVTWDDPDWDVPGRVNHTNFLCSTREIVNSHGANDFVTPPTDNAYDNAFWRDSCASFVLVGDEIYYIDSDYEADVYTLNTYDGTVLCSVADEWIFSETEYYVAQSRLATDGEYLYYSLSDGIYRYDIATATARAFYKPDVNFGEYFDLYGFRIVDGTFEMVFHDDAYFDIDTKKNYTLTYRPDPAQEALFSLSGVIQSQNPRNETTLQLWQNGVVAYTYVIQASATVGTTDTTFCIPGVQAGIYDLVVTKRGHFPYTVKGITIDQDTDLTAHANPKVALLILVCGDVDGDACVDLKDVQMLTADHTFNKSYDTAVNKGADINGDGLIDLQDLILLTSAENFNKGKTEACY